MRFYGGLARSGKVKAQTPRVEKSTTKNNKYSTSKSRSSDHDVEHTDSSKPYTFAKYNTLKGWENMEFIQSKKERRIQEEKNNNYWNRNPSDTNHKKWYRNHPKQGFYQSRQVMNVTQDEN